MKKTWILIIHEYTRHVLRKRFLFALLSIPLWIGISVGAGVLSVVLTIDTHPVGYVDHANLLDGVDFESIPSNRILDVEFIRYENEELAKDQLDGERIQAYFVLAPDYLQTFNSSVVYLEEPDNGIYEQFANMLRYALLQDKDPAVVNRLLEGAQPVIHATQEDRQMAPQEWFKIAAPIVAGVFLIVSVFTSSGYLMQAIVDEKENRTMEIIATSLSPMQIMGGKIIALISVGLTQVFVWSIFPLVAILIGRQYLPFLQDITIDGKLVVLVVVTAFPTFVLISALMATIGATATEAREGQQVSTLVTLPAMSPFMLFSVILANPAGLLAVGLSLFPLTAALTILIRMAFASVPGWQIVLSASLLILSAVGSLWLSGRVFRIGMLRYGKRMSVHDILTALTGRFEEARKEAPSHE